MDWKKLWLVLLIVSAFLLPFPASGQDSDRDGLSNSWENNYLSCMNPAVNDGALDPDSDSLENRDEYRLGSSPCLADTDGGGESDESEIHFGRNPALAADDAVIVTIGTDATGWRFPLAAANQDVRTQSIYLASEIGRSGIIQAVSLDITTAPGQTLDNFIIRMMPSPYAAYGGGSGWEPGSNFYLVYQGNEAPGLPGWRTFRLAQPFFYDNTMNMMVDFSFDNATSSTDGLCRYSSPGGKRSLTGAMDGAPMGPTGWIGTNPVNPASTARVPNLRLLIAPDTDGDGLLDEWEVKYGCMQPGVQDDLDDYDLDGLLNYQEQGYATDPCNPDTDGDLMDDGAEVDVGSNPGDPDIHPGFGAVSGSFPVSGGAVDPEKAALAWTGSGYLVAWSDKRMGNYELYLQRVDYSGPIGGNVRLTSNTYEDTKPDFVWSGGVLGACWLQNGSAVFSRFSADGANLGPNIIIPNAWACSIAAGTNQWTVAYNDTTGLHLRRFTAAGGPLGTVSNISSYAYANHSLAWDVDRYRVAYQTPSGIDFGWVLPDGTVSSQFTAITGSQAKIPAMAGNGAGGFGLTWLERWASDGLDHNVHFLAFDSIYPVSEDLVVSPGANTINSQSLTWSGRDYFAFYTDVVPGGTPVVSAIAVSRIAPGGATVLDQARIITGTASPTGLDSIWTGQRMAAAWVEQGNTDEDAVKMAEWAYDDDGDGIVNPKEPLLGGLNPNNWDTDHDGISDGYEISAACGFNPVYRDDASLDYDGDVISNLQEYQLGLDACLADTDGDGLSDDDEIYLYFTNPANPDTDDDGASDGAEVAAGTDRIWPDSDGDGMLDGYELANPCLNALAPDAVGDFDGDGLTNLAESGFGSSACAADTDGDGLGDPYEVAHSCLLPAANDLLDDPDGDLLDNGAEQSLGADPCDPDTDHGGLEDGTEVALGRDPLDASDDHPCAVYVSADTGSDAIGDGSTLTPFATIGRGVAVALTGDTVCVAGGLYYEQVSLPRRLTLEGGYSPSTWERKPTVFHSLVAGFGHRSSVSTGLAMNGTGGSVSGFAVEDFNTGIYSGNATVSENLVYNCGSGIMVYDMDGLSPPFTNIHDNLVLANGYGIQQDTAALMRPMPGEPPYCWPFFISSSLINNTISMNQVGVYSYIQDWGVCPATMDTTLIGNIAYDNGVDFRTYDYGDVWFSMGSNIIHSSDGNVLITDYNIDPLFWDNTHLDHSLRPNSPVLGGSYGIQGRTWQDTDHDGITDDWERHYSLDMNQPADADLNPDGDGLINRHEYFHWCDPALADTDGDGLSDQYETETLHSRCWDSDSDRDTLTDPEEETLGTDPVDSDTDHDTMPDPFELDNPCLSALVNDLNSDPDSDGMNNYLEYSLGSLPCDADSDDDGMPDGYERNRTCLNLLIPNGNADPDGDGLANSTEYAIGTEPCIVDSDADHFPDGYEVAHACLSPATADSPIGDPDGDGAGNLAEYQGGSNPCVADTDGDGLDDGYELSHPCLDPAAGDTLLDADGDLLTNGREAALGADPCRADTDADGLDDYAEINVHSTNPLAADSDGDSHGDYFEVTLFLTNPLVADPDADHDRLPDVVETGTGVFSGGHDTGTSPADLDCDDDGVADGTEVMGGSEPLLGRVTPDYLPSGEIKPLTASAQYDNSNLSVAWTGSEYGLAWTYRLDYQFTRLTPAGDQVGPVVPINCAYGDVSVLVNWNSQQFGMILTEAVMGPKHLFFTAFSPAGAQTMTDRRITYNATYWAIDPTIAWTGSEYGLAWNYYLGGAWGATFTRLTPSGVKIGSEVTIEAVSTSSGSRPSMVWTGSQYGIGWLKGPQVIFRRLSPVGAKLGYDVGLTYGLGVVSAPLVAWTGSEFGIAFSQYMSPSSDLMFSRVSADSWTYSTLRLTTSGSVSAADLAWTGSEFGISWMYQGKDMRFQRLTRYGSAVRPLKTVFSAAGTVSAPTRIVWTGSEYGVFWSMGANKNLYFSRIVFDGDGDGLAPAVETGVLGTDPADWDTDLDSIDDGFEASSPCLDPLVYESGDDPDGDGYDNLTEYLGDTDPCQSSDTDQDGLSDEDEVNLYLTDPGNPDTDGDGMIDGAEVAAGADPLLASDFVRAVPRLLTYQARLLDDVGLPVSGAVAMVFSICDSVSGGAVLWSEGSTVDVTGGIFQAMLGGRALIPDELFVRPDLWLQVEAGGQTLQPRKLLTADAEAVNAGRVGGARLESGAASVSVSGATAGARVVFERLFAAPPRVAIGPESLAVGGQSFVVSRVYDVTPAGFSVSFENPGGMPATGQIDFTWLAHGE